MYGWAMRTWQVQTAKQRFSEVLRAAQAGEPQFITKHGTPVAAIIDFEDYRAMSDPKLPFSRFLVESLAGVGLDAELELPPREVDIDRSLDLFEA